jgi:hypothetical protein
MRPSADNRHKLALLSKRVATAVTEIVHSAEVLKGILYGMILEHV